MTSETPIAGLALLRVKFQPNQISKLPKGSKAQNECQVSEKRDCDICGGWHHPKIKHLDYVGHAALTDRLLDADPLWSWEPLAISPDGLPVLDGYDGMWIKLTVCGVTRLGYGHADGKTGGNAIKELIGDALRNAAMRFGAALDLWHKGDLHGDDEPQAGRPGAMTPANVATLLPVPADGDTSPKARAHRIIAGIASGDAVGAAIAMSGWDQNLINEVWALLDAKTTVALDAAWPKVAA